MESRNKETSCGPAKSLATTSMDCKIDDSDHSNTTITTATASESQSCLEQKTDLTSHSDSSEWETAEEESESDIEDLEIDIIIQLKITLRGITPKIWRRIQVSSSDTFEELHYYIQVAMGWRMCHLHSFMIGNVTLVENSSYDFYKSMGDEHVQKEEGVALREYFRKFGDTVLYEYDHGDGWLHEIVFEKFVLTPNQNVEYPRCVEGKRACPPEDCGGVSGYKHLLKVRNNPEHAEYEELIEDWLENFYPGFDPEKFDKNVLPF